MNTRYKLEDKVKSISERFHTNQIGIVCAVYVVNDSDSDQWYHVKFGNFYCDMKHKELELFIELQETV